MIKKISQIGQFLHEHVTFLDNSKLFAGLAMIMINVGSKFITIQFSKSTEEYLKYSVSKQLLIFSMGFLATRSVYTALILTIAFTLLSDHLFNDQSPYCVVPHKYRALIDDTNAASTNVTEAELAAAISVMERAKKERSQQAQKESFVTFHKYTLDKII